MVNLMSFPLKKSNWDKVKIFEVTVIEFQNVLKYLEGGLIKALNPISPPLLPLWTGLVILKVISLIEEKLIDQKTLLCVYNTVIPSLSSMLNVGVFFVYTSGL